LYDIEWLFFFNWIKKNYPKATQLQMNIKILR